MAQDDAPTRAWERWLPWAAVAVAAVTVGSVVADLALAEVREPPPAPSAVAGDGAMPDDDGGEREATDTASARAADDVEAVAGEPQWFTVTLDHRGRDLTTADEELAAALASVEGESGRGDTRPRGSLAVPVEDERDRAAPEPIIAEALRRLEEVPGVRLVTHAGAAELTVAGDTTADRLEDVPGVDEATPHDPT